MNFSFSNKHNDTVVFHLASLAYEGLLLPHGGYVLAVVICYFQRVDEELFSLVRSPTFPFTSVRPTIS